MYSFSIIIPVYNAEKTLDYCIESIIRQNYSDYEIILIDDGSKDDSLKYCNSLAEQYKNIYVYHKYNSGAGLTRNFGLKKANKDFCIFLDADDYLRPNTLKELDSKICSDSDIIVCDYYKKNEDEIVEQYESLKLSRDIYVGNQIKKELYPLLLGRNPLVIEHDRMTRALWNYVFSRKLIIDNKLEFLSEREIFSEDLMFLINSFLCANKVQYINNGYYVHIYQKDSLSSNLSYININSIFALYKLECEICEKNAIKEYDRIKFMLFINIVGSAKKISKASRYSKQVALSIKELYSDKFFEIIPYSLARKYPIKYFIFWSLLRCKGTYLIYKFFNFQIKKG